MEGGVPLNYPLNTMSTTAHTIPGPCNTSRMTNSGVCPRVHTPRWITLCFWLDWHTYKTTVERRVCREN